MTLAEFLLARIAEDESAARSPLSENRWQAIHPRRVLAECEAKRRIVTDCAARMVDAEADLTTEAQWVAQFATETLWSLAFPYADHADFRYDEWHP